MGVDLLLQDLRRKSEERIAVIRRQAESDAAGLRAEQERELAAVRAHLIREKDEAERAVAEPIVRQGEMEALRIRDAACRQLAGRLYALAVEQLAVIRDDNYPAIFAALVAELPEVAWSEVRVNPRDLALARLHFPEAELKGDPAIIGGFAAGSDGGRHRVVSTLERRLARAWPFALPGLLQEIEEGLHAPSAD